LAALPSFGYFQLAHSSIAQAALYINTFIMTALCLITLAVFIIFWFILATPSRVTLVIIVLFRLAVLFILLLAALFLHLLAAEAALFGLVGAAGAGSLGLVVSSLGIGRLRIFFRPSPKMVKYELRVVCRKYRTYIVVRRMDESCTYTGIINM
jgi:cellulose synthase/poly-beta-1,6-N-acetylglucosamine synthase-like glycosyltransferase